MKKSEIHYHRGTGFIGQKLISKLLLENNEVIAIVRPGSVKNKILPKNPNLTLKACDLSSLDCLNLPESDVFIHLGWKGQRVVIDKIVIYKEIIY